MLWLLVCGTWIDTNMKVSCSICDQQFDTSDPDWPRRKERHIERHSKGRSDGVNNSYGIVEWVTVW